MPSSVILYQREPQGEFSVICVYAIKTISQLRMQLFISWRKVVKVAAIESLIRTQLSKPPSLIGRWSLRVRYHKLPDLFYLTLKYMNVECLQPAPGLVKDRKCVLPKDQRSCRERCSSTCFCLKFRGLFSGVEESWCIYSRLSDTL